MTFSTGDRKIEAFDLLEFQKKARETCCPKALFELWEDVCRRYDKRLISLYEFEEMKEAIWPNLHALASLKRSINEVDDLAAGDTSDSNNLKNQKSA